MANTRTVTNCCDCLAAYILLRNWYIFFNPENTWYYCFYYFVEVLIMNYVNNLHILRGVLTQQSVFHFSIGLLSLFDFSADKDCVLVGGVCLILQVAHLNYKFALTMGWLLAVHLHSEWQISQIRINTSCLKTLQTQNATLFKPNDFSCEIKVSVVLYFMIYSKDFTVNFTMCLLIFNRF